MNNEDGKETYPLQKRVQKIGIKVSAATEVETRKKRVEREIQRLYRYETVQLKIT